MDALTLEEYTCRTWPTLETVELDGWLLRFAHGVTGRANAAYPLYPSKRDVPTKIEQVEVHYRQRGLRPMFKLAEPLHRTLDALLAQRGYAPVNPSRVMALQLPASLDAPDHTVSIEPFSEAWFAPYARAAGLADSSVETYRALLTAPIGTRWYASVQVGDERVAFGVVSLSRAYAGVYSMVTTPTYRRQGMATSVLRGLLRAAREKGGKYAFLQVAADNATAQGVYGRCGFLDVYAYGYRALPA
jgi:ribosomal protein S18 acetylase RimI-like enzyme